MHPVVLPSLPALACPVCLCQPRQIPTTCHLMQLGGSQLCRAKPRATSTSWISWRYSGLFEGFVSTQEHACSLLAPKLACAKEQHNHAAQLAPSCHAKQNNTQHTSLQHTKCNRVSLARRSHRTSWPCRCRQHVQETNP